MSKMLDSVRANMALQRMRPPSPSDRGAASRCARHLAAAARLLRGRQAPGAGFPVPGLAKVLDVSVDALIADDGLSGTHTPPPRRTRRRPVSHLERQLDAIARLPKAQQKAVSTVRRPAGPAWGRIGQEVATAS